MADSAGDHSYINTSWARRLVSSYTGLTFIQVGSLNFIQFLKWRRDAYIYHLEQSEAGVEYLRNAWRMEQTKPDRKALHSKFGKGPTSSGKQNY